MIQCQLKTRSDSVCQEPPTWRCLLTDYGLDVVSADSSDVTGGGNGSPRFELFSCLATES